MKCEILYLAWNRRAYTEASFRLLHENTDWRQVSRLIVYDDGSDDGTAEYLAEAGLRIGVPAFEFRQQRFRSPPALMNDYLATTEAEVFVKVDNDIALPPNWLAPTLSVMRRHPELELLGLDAGMTGVPEVPWAPHRCGYDPCAHIGGVGAMRAGAFHRRPAIMARGRHGFTHWQEHHEPVRGWITPGLATAELDRIPEEPWQSLAREYVARGWAREWRPYSSLHPWWDWINAQIGVAA